MSKHQKSNIPNSLKECMQTDKVVVDLYDFALQLKEWSIRVFVIFMSIGVICTIVDVVSLIDVNEDAILPTLVTSIFTWFVYACIAMYACRILAMLINALASITENTKISANVALWEAAKKETCVADVEPQQEQPKTEDAAAPKVAPKAESVIHADGRWSCAKCGQKNLSIRTTCWRCDHQK